MALFLTCPYCTYRQPLQAGGGAQFCLKCDNRLFNHPTYRDYRPLRSINYADPPQVVRINPELVSAEPEPDIEAEAEAEELEAILAELRPWWFSCRLIITLLFTLTPLGLVLLWAQTPRDPRLGGRITRLLITLLLGPAWLAGAVLYYPVVRDAALQAPVVQQALNPPLVTRAVYEQIRPGDTYASVRSLIGAEGLQTSSFRLDPTPGLPALDMAVYEWRNPDGGMMTAVFQNGRLERKSQVGLP